MRLEARWCGLRDGVIALNLASGRPAGDPRDPHAGGDRRTRTTSPHLLPDRARPSPRLPRAAVRSVPANSPTASPTRNRGSISTSRARPRRSAPDRARARQAGARHGRRLAPGLADADEDHRLNGAESEDTYLRLPVPYRSRNGPLEDIRELLQIHGVTPEIYYGHDQSLPLRDFVTVHGSPQININTAPRSC